MEMQRETHDDGDSNDTEEEGSSELSVEDLVEDEASSSSDKDDEFEEPQVGGNSALHSFGNVNQKGQMNASKLRLAESFKSEDSRAMRDVISFEDFLLKVGGIPSSPQSSGGSMRRNSGSYIDGDSGEVGLGEEENQEQASKEFVESDNAAPWMKRSYSDFSLIDQTDNHQLKISTSNFLDSLGEPRESRKLVQTSNDPDVSEVNEEGSNLDLSSESKSVPLGSSYYEVVQMRDVNEELVPELDGISQFVRKELNIVQLFGKGMNLDSFEGNCFQDLDRQFLHSRVEDHCVSGSDQTGNKLPVYFEGGTDGSLSDRTLIQQRSEDSAELDIALARCRVLENKVEELTVQLEHRPVSFLQVHDDNTNSYQNAAHKRDGYEMGTLDSEKSTNFPKSIDPNQLQNKAAQESPSSGNETGELADSAYSELEARIKTLESQLAFAQARADALEKERSRLEFEIAEIRAETDAEIGTRISDTVDQLKDQLQTSNRELLELKRILKGNEDKIEMLEKERASLNARLEQQQNLRHTIDDLQANLEEQLSKSKRLETQILQMGWAQKSSPSRLSPESNSNLVSNFAVTYPNDTPPPRERSMSPTQKSTNADHNLSNVSFFVDEPHLSRTKRDTQSRSPSPELPSSSMIAFPSFDQPLVTNSLEVLSSQEEDLEQKNLMNQQEEEVVRKLHFEKVKLQQAQARIHAANVRSSKSLEYALQELRSLELARARAESRAKVLEEQAYRTEQDIVRFRSAADSDAELSEAVLENPSPKYRGQYSQQSSFESDGSHFQPIETMSMINSNDTEIDTVSRAQKETRDQTVGTIENSTSDWYEKNQDVPQKTKNNRSQWSLADMFPSEEHTYTRERKIDRRSLSPPRRENRAVTKAKDNLRRESWAPGQIESNAPFATDSSTRDFQKGFSLLERKLMMINLERQQCEAEFDKLANKGIKTKKALEEKIYLENRLAELNQEASNVRIALKRAPK